MRPSVTSLVWSHDQYVSQYVAYTSIQEPRLEIIKDMKPMVKEALKAFIKKLQANGANAMLEHILFYRDGVRFLLRIHGFDIVTRNLLLGF